MKRTSLSSIFLFSIWLGGCAPAAKPVTINFKLISVSESVKSASISGPRVEQSRLQLSGSVGGRGARLLEEKEGVALWNQARETLAENREKSLNRLRSDLERKYMGESRANAIAAEEANREADNLAWQEVLDQVEELMSRYAGEKTELSADLAGRIGFPDKGQSVPRRRQEEVYAEMRAEKVKELREQLGELDARFEAELSAILLSYQRERQQRIVELLELDYAGDQAAIARAEQEALEAIRAVMGQVDAAIPELQKRLEPLNATIVQGESAEAVRPRFETQEWTVGLSEQELREYAIVFVKSRGYEISTSSKAVDVTEEFREWLQKNAVTR